MINFTDEDEIEAAFEYFRRVGFPYPTMQQHQIINAFRRLQNAKAKINKQVETTLLEELTQRDIEIQPIGDVFLVNYFHPHIWDSKAVNMKCPTESFKSDKLLRRALRLVLEGRGQIPLQGPKELYMTLVSGTQMCSNFRPTAAKAIYDYLKPKDVLDMSTGYGGRLLGFLASKSTGKYYGIDPSKQTCKCNLRIAKTLGVSHRVSIKCIAFEDVKSLPKIDLAFSSPPYFIKEIYDAGNTKQSRERYPKYEDWCNIFLRSIFKKTKPALRKDGILALNIMDVNIRKKLHPLVLDTMRIADEEGYKVVEKLRMVFSGFGKGLKKEKSEPVLVFKRK